jgi:hypothetical protein
MKARITRKTRALPVGEHHVKLSMVAWAFRSTADRRDIVTRVILKTADGEITMDAFAFFLAAESMHEFFVQAFEEGKLHPLDSRMFASDEAKKVVR